MTPEELDKFLTETTKSNKSLETLDLSRKELTELSPKIKNFQHLVVLNLYDNKLLSLPNEIGDLKNLRELGLSENRLTTLPKTIGNLVNLLTLDLRFNKYGVPVFFFLACCVHSSALETDQLALAYL